MKIKVGSLFDGIGGTPLSAVLSGAEPVWASEIEKIPISITKRHFPNMKHYGDITQINGAEIEPVDIIVGGSPCQDLSVAGKRAGLEGARSGLFMDQVRIVKEMRNATRRETSDRSTELPRPRYMVWENVPGAFSSNKGEDFRAVLEEICRVKDETVIIPGSPKGKWSTAGAIMGNGYSIAWRIVDAQHWGVPQRRRRIYLVADFGGHTAPEICFEQESVSGDITEGGETGQRIAADAERRTGTTEYLTGWDNQERRIFSDRGVSPTLSGSDGGGGRTMCRYVMPSEPVVCYGICPTLTARMGTGGNQVNAVCGTYSFQRSDELEESDVACTQSARQYKSATDLVVGKQVRRLTPLECERLQGYPDGWTALDHEDKPVSDTQRYKALGNSFAVPNALFFISRCVKKLQEEQTGGTERKEREGKNHESQKADPPMGETGRGTYAEDP